MFQQILIVGNVGRDPEMRYTPNGQPVTSFSVATENKYTGRDGQQVKETTWFKVTTWGKQAEICNEYVKKGSRVLVTGRLQADEHGNPRTWQDNSGNSRASFEINADNVRFLSNKSRDDEGEFIP